MPATSVMVMSFLLPVAAGMVSVLMPVAAEFQKTFVLAFVVVAVRPDGNELFVLID